jgi:hypothetical protein
VGESARPSTLPTRRAPRHCMDGRLLERNAPSCHWLNRRRHHLSLGHSSCLAIHQVLLNWPLQLHPRTMECWLHVEHSRGALLILRPSATSQVILHPGQSLLLNTTGVRGCITIQEVLD